MTPILQWAQTHAITPQALDALLAVLGLAMPPTLPPPPGNTPGNESSIQTAVRIQHARLTGGRLWRNNVGIAYDDRGVPVRFGLANDSAQANKICKSSDLIGITPVRCQCGRLYGVFTAYECKRSGWRFKQSDDRATAQLAFGKLVISLGGMFRFITSPEEL